MSMSAMFPPGSGASSPTAGETYIPIALGATIPFYTLALLTYGLRIWTRWKRNFLGLDDHLMGLAMLMAIPTLIIYYTVIFKAGGIHLADSGAELINVLKYEMLLSFVLLPLTVWCMSVIKVSACVMILRIKDTKWWKITLWSYSAILIGFSLGTTIAHLTKCRPLRTSWTIAGQLGGSTGEGVCWKTSQLLLYSYILSGFFTVTDLFIALLPLAFIVKIKRDMREKVLLTIVMALGLVATGCTIAKIPLIQTPFEAGKDPLWEGYKVLTLCVTEISTAIIAANLPCLRFLLQSITRALGWESRKPHTSYRYPQAVIDCGDSDASGLARQKQEEFDVATAESQTLRDSTKQWPKAGVDERWN